MRRTHLRIDFLNMLKEPARDGKSLLQELCDCELLWWIRKMLSLASWLACYFSGCVSNLGVKALAVVKYATKIAAPEAPKQYPTGSVAL